MGLPENSGIKLTNRYEKGPGNLITEHWRMTPGISIRESQPYCPTEETFSERRSQRGFQSSTVSAKVPVLFRLKNWEVSKHRLS